MDFKELLLEADRKHQEAVKQSQQIKRLNTNFTAPASREQKSSGPRSEAIQKLLDEKKKEERQKREAEEREKRRKEKARQEREREEKRKNTFRIPKKVVSEDPPSDPESFSSISSGDEAKLSNNTTAKRHGAPTSSSSRADSEKSHKSSSHGHSEKKDRHSHKTSEHSSSSSNHKSKHRSSEHSSRDQNRHRSETDKTKQHTDKHRHSSEKRDHSQHRSETDKTRHHTDKHRHSSEKQESGSSKTGNSSEKDKSHGSTSNSNSVTHKSHKHSHKEQNHKHIIKDKVLTFTENDTSGYITSPDISSEEEEELPESTSKPSSSNTSAHRTGKKSRTNSTDVREEKGSAPVELIRHHLKPTKDRTGGSLEERAKILERLQAIRERMAENESGPGRKRAAWGEVKKRRAKREKLDGDFSGSCMEKINYDEEEKPSLKRPEPKPEEPKEKVSKENKKRSRDKLEKVKEKRKVGNEKREIKSSGKINRFDEMHKKSEKPAVKSRPRPRPPPVNFADLMKMAEQKQAEPVMVEVAHKEKERRPLTQEELDRKQAREERLKAKDYKDWYKYGNNTSAKQGKPEKIDPDSGGFLRPNHSVLPPENGAGQSKPFSIPRKNENAGSAKVEKHPAISAISSRPSASQTSASRSAPIPKSRPHPTRPGMIANKPQAMAQHMNSERKAEARPGGEEKQKASSSSSSSQDTSSQPRPVASTGASVDKTRGGNAWDRLFSQPEYQRMTQSSASKKRKLVIDSEEEDEYDEEMDDFIDDEGEENLGSVSSMIQQMFGYNRKKYRDEDEDDRDMEVGFCQVMKEEARSARIGKKEDLEDIRREQAELKMKAERKKMKK